MSLSLAMTLMLSGAWAAWAGFTDWRVKRIPNVVVLVGIGLACLGVVADDGVAFGDEVLGVLLALLLFFPGYYNRVLGAGDVKLGVVAGFFWGSAPVLVGVLVTGVGAAVMKITKPATDGVTLPVATWFLPGAYLTWMIPLVFQPAP